METQEVNTIQEDNKEEFIERIKRWYKYSEKFKEDISDVGVSTRFIYLWISFNALYNLYCENLNHKDHIKIENALDCLFKEKYNLRDFFDNNKDNFKKLVECKVIDMKAQLTRLREGKKITKNYYYNEYDKEYDKTKDMLKQIKIVFNIINRIRNNLIHGSKGSLSNAGNDRKLFCLSSSILSNLLEEYVKNN